MDAKFHTMEQSTSEDWFAIGHAKGPFQRELPDRVLGHLRLLEGDTGAFAVDRLQHSLQTATRAFRAGEEEDYIVCALLHDIGDMLGSANHADIEAAILKPYVSDSLHWMIAHHGVFQGSFYYDKIGLDRDAREKFRGHPSFELTAKFCEVYDQNSFDPMYDSMPLQAFEPMTRRVFARLDLSKVWWGNMVDVDH